MNTYKVFVGGSKDANGNYYGGECVGTFKNERKAWETYREYSHSLLSKSGYVYMLREGDEVFKITKGKYWYHITDLSERLCYGVCETLSDAIKEKEWCEKYHTLGWYIP